MRDIPKEMRVGVRIRYNGYLHTAVALLDKLGESSSVRIFSGQLPKGYRAEHGTDEIEFILRDYCVVPDPSGEHGWIATGEIDLDAFAGPGRRTG
jgi:hypothetical protein